MREFLEKALIFGHANRQWANAIAHWKFPPGTELDLAAIVQQIQNDSYIVTVGVRVTCTETTLAAFMRKKDKSYLPADRFLVNGIAPETFKPVYVNSVSDMSSVVMSLMKSFHEIFDRGISDFITTPAGDWSAAMLVHVQRHLSLAQLQEQINDARIAYSPKKDENLASEYQCAIVKAAAFCINAKKEQTAAEMDEQASLEQSRKNHAYVFEGSRAVLPNDCFQNLDNLFGTRVDEWTGELVSVTWKQFMSNPELFENHCAVILGSNETSGFGKSALAVRSALNMGKAMAMQRGLPASDGRCITRNSIEACRGLHDLRWPLVVDEFSPTDGSQAKHWSLDIAKVIGNMAMARDIRANYKNVDIPPHTPTIFTANAGSLDKWMGDDFKDCLPILRRFFVFILTPDPLNTNRMIKKDKLKEHLAAIRKNSTNDSMITKDCMLGLWGLDAESTDDAAPAAVVANSPATSSEAAPSAAAVVDSAVTSGEAAPSAVAVVDSTVTSDEVAPVAMAVDSGVASDEVAPVAMVVDSGVASGEMARTVRRHSKQDAIDAFFGKPVVRAPGTPETSAVIPIASTPVKKQNLKQAKIGAFLEDQRPVAAIVGSAATSGNVAPGFLVLSRRRHDDDEGLWVLDLALFREGYP